MKRLLIPLLAALASPTAVNAGVDPEVHNLCKEVKDYMGCVKANSKKEVWNPFKKSSKETNSKKSFQLSQSQKDEWCDFSESINDFPLGVERCVKNLETLGPKILSISLEKHLKCNPVVALTPRLNSYMACLENNANENLLSILRVVSDEDKKRISNDQKEIDEFELKKGKKNLNIKDTIFHKGKFYTASRECPDGESMRWQTYGFRKKLEELGCMTEKEHEAYWRTAKQRKREKDSQALKEGLEDLGNAINPPTVYCDSFDYGTGISTTCQQY